MTVTKRGFLVEDENYYFVALSLLCIFGVLFIVMSHFYVSAVEEARYNMWTYSTEDSRSMNNKINYMME